MMRRGVIAAAMLAALRRRRRRAQAQTYPSRPITIIVPFPAGGSTGAMARILLEPLQAALGQPIIIENIGGAGGSIGVGRVARAAPDGYTISFSHMQTHVLNGAVLNLPYRRGDGFRAGRADLGYAADDRRPQRRSRRMICRR